MTRPTRPERWQAFRRLFNLARPEWRRLALATVALLLSTAVTLSYPQLIRIVVDDVLGGTEAGGLNRFAGLLILLFAAGALFTAARVYLFTVAGERIVANLRQQLYGSLVRQEVAFFDAHRTGELTNRLASDTAVVQSAASVNISMLLRFALSGLGSLAILLWTSWRLSLVMLALVPLAAVGGLIYGRIVRRLSKQVQDALARSTEVAEETLAGIRTVRAFAREGAEDARYCAEVDAAFEIARERARFAAWFGGLAGFAGYGAIGGVLWYGGALLVDGLLSVGELSSFLLYTLGLAFAITMLGTLWQDFMRAIGASERVFELIERVPRVTKEGDRRLTACEGRVRFEAVDFTYPVRPDAPVLRGVELALDPGQVLALVGPSGGGKSTVVALLSRFYDPDTGTIRLDGHDLRSFDPDWLREQVGVVPQEPILFATTIRENILYGRPEASEAEVIEAARAANVEGFVRELPEGFETLVGERGVRLSGGQKQRVAIARAVLKDPRVLVLDEATSALDAESEHLVQEALRRLMRGRTTVVIAHRLSTVKAADQIAVLDRGRVVQLGRHEALIEQEGLYRQLVRRQQFAA